MYVTVVETEMYLAAAEKIMSAAEMEDVLATIAMSPMAGDVIPGSQGLRKLRIPLQGRGKRGGGRVVYWYYNEGVPLLLMWAYSKSKTNDLTSEQTKLFIKVAHSTLESYRN